MRGAIVAVWLAAQVGALASGALNNDERALAAGPVRALAGPVRALDTHVHITNFTALRYPDWANASAGVCPCAAPCACDWTPDDWTAAAASLSPQRFVFVEVDADPNLWLDEALYIQGLADAGDGRIGGIVAKNPPGFGDPSTPDAVVAARLDALAALPLARGVRLNLNFSDAALIPTATRHVALLAARRLSVDVCLGGAGGDAGAIAGLQALVAASPAATFIIDHGASPPALGSAAELAAWRANVAWLGARPNVFIKFGGFLQYFKAGLQAPSAFPSVGQVAPLAGAVLDAFGYERAMFEANWFFVLWWQLPPAQGMDEYATWVSYLSEILAARSPAPTAAQLDALYYGTGAFAYRVTAA